MKRLLLGGLAMTALVSAGCTMLHVTSARLRMTNKAAPDFTLTALNGDTVRLSDFRGKSVVLTFFAVG